MSTDHCFEFSGARVSTKPTLVKYPTLGSFVELSTIKCEESVGVAFEDSRSTPELPFLASSTTTTKALRTHSPLIPETLTQTEAESTSNAAEERVASQTSRSHLPPIATNSKQKAKPNLNPEERHLASPRCHSTVDTHERILKKTTYNAPNTHPFDSPPAERKTRYSEFRTYYYTFRTAQFLSRPPEVPTGAEPFPDNLIFLNISMEQEAAFHPLREVDIQNVVRTWIWRSVVNDWAVIHYGDECSIGLDKLCLTVRQDLTPTWISVKAMKAKKAKLAL
ncbi:hypothetical protein FB446DRAFT_792575 [Lentinula raphanica]|nr:hypothetical protein FB446DRAFT_792575 [Lentinula raphanica]